MGTTKGRRSLLGAAVLSVACGTLAPTLGCAVSDTDVHRWETTEAGPEKLYAIVTHDKYSLALREEAALSLVRMRPRNGKRVGLEYLAIGYDTTAGRVPGALSVLTEEARRSIVDGITPKLVDAIDQPPPVRPTAWGRRRRSRPERPVQGRGVRSSLARTAARDRREDQGGARRRAHPMGPSRFRDAYRQ